MSRLIIEHYLRSPKSPGTRARTNNGWLSSCYFLSRHRRCIATGAMLSSHDSPSESIFVCSYCHRTSCKYESYFHIFNTMYIANFCQWCVNSMWLIVPKILEYEFIFGQGNVTLKYISKIDTRQAHKRIACKYFSMTYLKWRFTLEAHSHSK